MAVKYNYKYKPTAASYFTNTGLGEREKLTKSLTSQTQNIEKRLEQQGVSVQGSGEVDQRGLVEKALNLGADQGMLMNILEVMDRPRQVVANVLSSLGNEDDRGVLEAAWEGLSGQKKISSKEALQKMVGDEDFLEFEDQSAGIDLADVGNFVIDLGLDMATDPTTYLGWKWLTKPVQNAMGGAGKLTSKLARAYRIYGEGVVKLAGQAVGAIETIARKGSYVFNAFKDLSDETIEGIKKINAKAGRMAEQLRSGIAFVRTKLAKTGYEDAERILMEIIENGGQVIEEGGKKVLKYGNRSIKVADTLESMLKNLSERGTGAHIIPKFGTNAALAQQQLDEVITQLNRIIPTSSSGQMFVQRLAADGSRAIEFNGTIDELKSVIEALKAGAGDPQSIWKSIIRLGSGIPTERAAQFFAEHGQVVEESMKSIRRIRKGAKALLSSFGDHGVAADVGETGTEYMRHTSSEFAKESMEAGKPVINQSYKTPGTDKFKARSYEGTAQEVNQALKSLYDLEGEVFNESALDSVQDLVTQAQRKYSQQETTKLLLGVKQVDGKWVRNPDTQAGLFMDIKENTAEWVKNNVPDGYKVLANGGQFRTEFSNMYKALPMDMQKQFDDILEAAGLEGSQLALNRSAYNVLKNLDNAYKDISPLVKAYDKFMGVWKATNLVTPGFHLRNLIGNSTNMFLAGMNAGDIIKYQGKAMAEMSRYWKLADNAAKGVALAADDLAFMARIQKFLDSGASQIVKAGTRDLDEVTELVAKAGSKAKGTVKKVVDWNFKMAEHADEVQRYAMWNWAMKKTGGNTTESLKTVRNALFDYSNLTPFERDYMKRLVPFYTFMKNNFVFQASNLMENTGQYVKLLRTYDKWNDNIGDIKTEDMPDYMSGNMWLPLPMLVEATDRDTISFLKLNLPPADFFEFIENPLKKGVTSVSVPIKLAWELGTGVDAFTGAPIKEFEGQENNYAGDGLLGAFRGEKGELRLSNDPTIQKISDELGLRTPRKLATAIFDVLDTATGAQSVDDLVKDVFGAAGISESKDLGEIELTQLYQYLEYLRNQKKLYEQETGNKLPGVAKSTNVYAKLR